jgi:preprotein translocase subunit SecY
MNRLIETIRNIFKIEELRKRILFTILIILVYRFGSFVVIPGIDPNQLSIIQRSSEGGLLGLLNMFSGGAFGNASIFALGIMPYITASIIIQLLGMAVPYFQRLQKEGESGRKKLNQIMRYLTVIIVIIQAPGYIRNVIEQFKMAGATTAVTPFDGSAPGAFFWISSVILLCAGTLFIMWLGEKITDRGIGNGISLIIMIGIIARLPGAFVAECAARFNQGGTGLLILVIELIVLFFVMVGTIALVQATRKIPVQYAKRVVGNRQYGGVRQYIPLKVNAAGVMPIIFAQAIMFLPVTIAGFRQTEALTGFAAAFTNINGFWYNLVFFLMIIAFTYFYTAVTMNTNQMAEDIKKNGGFIPGVKPGKKTAEYLDTIMTRITLPGSIFLGLVAIMPAIVARLMGVTTGFSHFYGGTSLLILVGVVLDTLQQIESHLLMHHYDGLTKTGRIKGRIGRM